MGWYDVFAKFYDASVEGVYAEHRPLAVEALRLEADSVVLDMPCGTGQSLEHLAGRLGPRGKLLGLDVSQGMLGQARARIQRHAWSNVALLAQDAQTLEAETLREALGGATVDRLHIFLGMSVFPDMHAAFERAWRLLAPGGRCVLVDVHTEALGVSGRIANLVARGDMRRRFWEPLERMADDFALVNLPFRKEHCGQIMMASGTKAPIS